MYAHSGEEPPSTLYVTDGGVSDNTTIIQQLLRKHTMILSVISSTDSLDDLKNTLQKAVQQRVANFFDPEDPRRGWESVIHSYIQNKKTFLHFGIYYGAKESRFDGKWTKDFGNVKGCRIRGERAFTITGEMTCEYVEGGLRLEGQLHDDYTIHWSNGDIWRREDEEIGGVTQTGSLFVICRRQPDHEKYDFFVQPPLTQAEFRKQEQKEKDSQERNQRHHWLNAHEDVEKQKMSELGSIPCCDCCHAGCCSHVFNNGPKFPDGGSNTLMMMSPKFFASLVRLGYAISDDCLKEIRKELEQPEERIRSYTRQETYRSAKERSLTEATAGAQSWALSDFGLSSNQLGRAAGEAAPGRREPRFQTNMSIEVTQAVRGNPQGERFVVHQADGHQHAIMKHPDMGREIVRIPNQEEVVKIADRGEDYLVRWNGYQGLVKKGNLRRTMIRRE